MMQTSPAILLDPAAPRRAADALSVRHAFFGLRLHAAAPSGGAQRLGERTLLLTRLDRIVEGLPGSGRALELRFVVWPGTAANGWQDRVSCYLLGRFSDWGCSAAQLRARALAYAAHLRAVLGHALPGYTFEPLLGVPEIEAARSPFPVVETGEVRRRVSDIPSETMLPLPFLGLPDPEALVELMLRQSAPSLLSICLEPTTVNASLLPYPDDDQSTVPPAISGIVRHRAMPSDTSSVEALTSAHDVAVHLRWQVQRLTALRQRAYRLRIQLASAAQLEDALITTLAGEVGGPGTHSAQSAWQDPGLPLAGGSVWARPRTTRPRTAAQSEHDVAVANLRRLTFAPWGADTSPCTHVDHLYLADLSEAVRLFALPGAAPWLPGRSGALALPLIGGAAEGVRLGVNPVRLPARPVVMPAASRHQHLWIVGQTGTGKSTLLETLILQDIRAGRGVIVLDPHGELIGQVLGKIPARRMRDVVLFDPADTAYPVGLNPLEGTTEDEQALVVSSFIGLLQKLYDPHHQGIVGPRFEHAARNGLLTVMSRPGGTLVEFVRVLTDDRFRNALLPHVQDPIVRRYWTDQIAQTSDFHRSEVLDWVVSKFGRFVTDPTIRRIIGQSQSGFSFRAAMDSGKIVLLSLAKGRVGGENANFLGLVLLPKILQAALSRVDLPDHERRDVSLYIDEFQNYATDALALMLAEARKYHLSLILANQHIGQLTPEIRDAVIGNVGSLVAFRLGLTDAAAMEHMLEPTPVTAQHLNGLPDYTAYARVLVQGQRTPTFTLQTEPVTQKLDLARVERIRMRSRTLYGRPRAAVDEEMNLRAKL